MCIFTQFSSFQGQMDCLIGAATGALKSVSLRESAFTNVLPVIDLDPKQHEVTALAWSGTDQTEVLVAQLDRQLRLYDSLTGTTSTLFTADAGTGKIKGLHITPTEQIVTACESGAVRVWDREGTEVASAEVGGGLLTMDAAADGRLATGGKANPLRVLDPLTLKEQWKSRNVKHDWLCLEVPVWDMQAKFLRDQKNIVTTTGTHKIRLYDPRAQRRPVKDMEWGEYPLTAVGLPSHDELSVIVANTQGEMAQFDLRKLRMTSKFKGQAGSIRCIQAHPSLPLVASCGIDRYLRVHDINTRKIVTKVYCKARLNTLLFKDELTLFEKQRQAAKELEEDWGLMVKKEEDEEGQIEEDVESDGEDPWVKLENDEEKGEEAEEESEDEEPPAKRKKGTEAKKGTRKGTERKRKESEGEREEVPEPLKRKKVLQVKRKQTAEKDGGVKKKKTK